MSKILSVAQIVAIRGYADSDVLDSHEALRKAAETSAQTTRMALAEARRVNDRFTAQVHNGIGEARTLILAWLVAKERHEAFSIEHREVEQDERPAAVVQEGLDLWRVLDKAERALTAFGADVRDTLTAFPFVVDVSETSTRYYPVAVDESESFALPRLPRRLDLPPAQVQGKCTCLHAPEQHGNHCNVYGCGCMNAPKKE